MAVNQSQDEAATLQQRIFRLAQQIHRTPGISAQTAAHIANELRVLSTNFNERTRQLDEERSLLVIERDNLNYDLQAKQRLVQNALAERDRACAERDQALRETSLLKTQFDNLYQRQQQAETRISEIEISHESTVREMLENIQFQEQQLAGKRSLWLDNHPSSAVRHTGSSAVRDPFTTPTGNGEIRPKPLKSEMRPTNLTTQFKSMQKPVSQKNTSTYLATIPSGPARPSQQVWSSKNSPGNRAHFGSDSPLLNNTDTQAVVPFQTLEQIASEFRVIFSSLFEKVEKWAFTYTQRVPDLYFDQKLSHDQDYWRFLVKCAFFHKSSVQEAHKHTILLLREQDTRAWFIMRIFIQYLIEEILVARNWTKFNKSFDENLECIEDRLREKGLSIQERGDLVTQRSHIVTTIFNSNGYISYRNFYLGKHISNLRGKLGPLLDQGAQRAEAGRDIGNVVVKAYDLSARMYMSFKTFVIVFPECGARFIDSSMVCRDDHIPDNNTLQLQIKQLRIKLAMSPVITIRDDRVRSIDVKDVQESHILTMR